MKKIVKITPLLAVDTDSDLPRKIKSRGKLI